MFSTNKRRSKVAEPLQHYRSRFEKVNHSILPISILLRYGNVVLQQDSTHPPTPPGRHPRKQFQRPTSIVSDAEVVPLVVFDIRLELVKFSVINLQLSLNTQPINTNLQVSVTPLLNAFINDD